MVTVDIKRTGDIIQEVIIRNHAGYAPKGQDLVCAGVSCISVGTLNALEKLVNGTCDLEQDSAYIHIVVKQHCDNVQIILKMMVIQLETMQESYKSYIKLNDQEV